MGKVDENKEKKRRALEDAAFSLFSEKGMQNTSISDIVERAGVAKGTFYLYFNDKYDIANILIYKKTGQLFMNALEALKKVKTLTLEDEMVLLAENIMIQLHSDVQLLDYCCRSLEWDLFKQMIEQTTDMGEYDFYGMYREVLGKYSDYDINNPETLVFLILTTTIQCCYSPIKFNKPCSFEEIRPFISDIVKNIITSNTTKKS
ncbi:TetR/AcrR family transcriptional regulator [bacterium]|nr:TetR/AcrR family transcriptional regulator [bacterium]